MKHTISFIASVLFLFFALSAKAQVKSVEKEAEHQGTNRVNNKIDQGISSGLDVIEEGIGSLFGKKKKKKTKSEDTSTETNSKNAKNNDTNANEASTNTETQKPEMDLQWAKFDFVPGDKVIFEDGPDANEENGEFPSRWDLVKGQVEIAKINGENILMFIDGTPTIVPYLQNAKEDYLPDVFTIEFDFYRPAKGNRISVYLYDDKNQKNKSNKYMDISYNSISEKLMGVTGKHPDYDYTWNEKARWIHVSIAFTKGKLKVYMDDTRMINIPHYSGNPTGLSLQAYWADLGDNKPFYFKNIRIAEGGVKYYDRILSDGKIIANGIRFDVNKATLKPESMGPINKIFDLMQKHPDLKFSVEGHTDGDGDEALNQTLSEARAKTVAEKLIAMGIAADRLSSKGFGESMPIDNNTTPEGKANNRRVEFVKF
jgi:OmpA-OmpF porin, OOP family